MQTRTERGKTRYQWSSLHEMGEWIANTPRTWPASINMSEKYRGGETWDLNTGYARAVELARLGWVEGAERAQEALKAFAPATPAPDTKVDFYGFRPHVPRFCAGAPDNMIRHVPVADTGCGRVLTLVVQIGTNSSTNAKFAANFGVAVAQYINQLETQGTRVELIATYSCGWLSKGRVGLSWTLKYADQPLDLAVIAFAIGHPAMFRRIVFAAMERTTLAPWDGYGYPEDSELSDLINPAPGTVILNGMTQANTYAPTPKKALEYVSEQIEAALTAQEL